MPRLWARRYVTALPRSRGRDKERVLIVCCVCCQRDGTCRLKFEGEEEVGKETEVERRLVLDVGNK